MKGKKRLIQTYCAVGFSITILLIYLSLHIAPFCSDTNLVNVFSNSLNSLKNSPFDIVWCKYSLKAIGIALFIGAICTLLLVLNAKNYRFGEEHGTAKWGNPHTLTKKYKDKNPHNNMLLTKNLAVSFDDRVTNLNSNVVVTGGPGSGKTYCYVLPNVLNANGNSVVVTDPKGSTLKKSGKKLKKEGYDLKVLDLKNTERSWGYNPFVYIRNEDDIFKIVELIFQANTPKNSTTQEPFFDDNAKFLFLACCYYLYFKAPEYEQNLPFVLEMLNYLELRDDDFSYISPFDELFLELQDEEPHNIAVDYYLKFRQAKGRTAMSVVSTLVAKIGKYSLPSIKSMSINDELNLRELADKKTALFLLLPDDDKSLNFIVSVLYMQLFQQLYDRAEEEPDDRLPRNVQMYMDEFANIKMPDDFDGIIATCRSRGIGISVILQGLAQLKKEYKEAYEVITAQCSIFMYMGGMEQSTHEYISKLLGKETINTNSFGWSRGKMPNYTKNDQLAGRELMTPDEVRLLPKRKAIVVMQGEPPIIDEQINTSKMKAVIIAKALGNYNHSDIEREVVKTKIVPIYHDDGRYKPIESDFSSAILDYSERQKKGV